MLIDRIKKKIAQNRSRTKKKTQWYACWKFNGGRQFQLASVGSGLNDYLNRGLLISSRLLIISGFSTSQSFHLPHALIHTHTTLLTLHASNKLDFATSSTMNHDLSYTFSRTLNHDLSFTLYEQSHPTTQWMLKPSRATKTVVTYLALETRLIIISHLSSYALINALTILSCGPFFVLIY